MTSALKAIIQPHTEAIVEHISKYAEAEGLDRIPGSQGISGMFEAEPLPSGDILIRATMIPIDHEGDPIPQMHFCEFRLSEVAEVGN